MDMNIDDFKLIVDALPQQLAVCNSDGVIIFVNESWTVFSTDNGMPADYNWLGKNYLTTCDTAIHCGDATVVADGMRQVFSGCAPMFTYEYPCHSPTTQRWFKVTVSPINQNHNLFLVIHDLITDRIVAQNDAQQIVNLSDRVEELAKLAFIDTLSQTLNRRGMEHAIEQAMMQATRYSHGVALMLIDIDHFKQINDQHGHNVGDDVIKHFAACLQNNVRESDIVGRWGGDEFVILFPETDAHVAMRFGERIQKNIAACNCGIDLPLTISYGVAALQTEQSVSDLIDHADRALYQAKRRGRDQGVLYSKILDNGF